MEAGIQPNASVGRTPKPKPEPRGEWLDYWESGYGWNGVKPSTPSFLMETWIDRPRDRLMAPVDEDRWELTDILRASDRRLGRAALMRWAATLDGEHPALHVCFARFGGHYER